MLNCQNFNAIYEFTFTVRCGVYCVGRGVSFRVFSPSIYCEKKNYFLLAGLLGPPAEAGVRIGVFRRFEILII